MWSFAPGGVVKFRRKSVAQSFSGLSSLNIEVDEESAAQVWVATIGLADKHNLSVYDATYLELAVRKQLPLATLDDELIAAARAEGLAVLP